VNTHLLDRIAAQTNAASQYVLPSEDIELKVSSFFARVRDPVLSNVTLRVSGDGVRVAKLQPAALPDLFSGDVVTVFGRYTGSGPATITIAGTFNGAPHEFSANVVFPAQAAGADYIPRMWATRRVGWLLDQVRLHGESAELRDEVTTLARTFGIVTPYTAYLVLEDENARGVPEALRSFQELEKDQSAAQGARDRLDSVRKEATTETSRSGAAAVANAQAVQGLESAITVPQAAPAPGLAKSEPAAGSGYRAAQEQNYAQQVQVVNGRAFYQNGSTWTDSTAQAQKGLARRSLRFASPEYFSFLAQNPSVAPWLALGWNIDLVVGGMLVSIRE
ncbi:MAG TPA: hypothetical protein VL359_02245, partial [bacterium]|nr:hypothetical protein [bacterium]